MGEVGIFFSGHSSSRIEIDVVRERGEIFAGSWRCACLRVCACARVVASRTWAKLSARTTACRGTLASGPRVAAGFAGICFFVFFLFFFCYFVACCRRCGRWLEQLTGRAPPSKAVGERAQCPSVYVRNQGGAAPWGGSCEVKRSLVHSLIITMYTDTERASSIKGQIWEKDWASPVNIGGEWQWYRISMFYSLFHLSSDDERLSTHRCQPVSQLFETV